MQDPSPIHLMTPEKSRSLGWAAEERDADGHIVSQHAPFDTDEGLARYVREAMDRGGTVTIWPHRITSNSAPQPQGHSPRKDE